MKILIDTNILLDVFYKRENLYETSLNVFKLCETKIVEGYISSLSIANIIYIMRKELNNSKINSLIKKLSLIFNIVDLTVYDLLKATEIEYSDYEDALQCVEASRLKLDYIITRNTKDFIHSNVRAITPQNFIENIIAVSKN